MKFSTRAVLLLVIGVIAAAAPSSTFAAGTATIGTAIEDVAVPVTLTGNSPVPSSLFATVRRAGGAPCAASASDDSGSTLIGFEPINGSYTFTRTFTPDEAGDFLICVWESETYRGASVPTSVTFKVQLPKVSLKGRAAPAIVVAGRPVSLSVTASSEAPRFVYATRRRDGGVACAPSANSDSGTNVIYGEAVDGARAPISSAVQTSVDDLGTWRVCMWVAEGANDAGADLVSSFTYRVVRSLKCVVPNVRGTSVAVAKARIVKAGCTVGRVTKKSSTAVPVGRVIGLSRATGARLPLDSKLNIVVRS